MNEIVWGLANLTSWGVDPFLGGSREHTAGHMDMASDQSTISQIANEKKTRRPAPPGRTQCRVARTTKVGTPDGVGPCTTILVVIIN